MRTTVCFSVILLLFLASVMPAQSWQSSRVQMDESGHLTYTVDADGNRIPDFSYAGYRNSEVALPVIGIVQNISPVIGDNTTHIQNAINAAGNLDADIFGFRGAVYLQAGEYNVSGTLHINKSGVVLRGAGDGADPLSNTIIKATGNSPARRTVIIAGGGASTSWNTAIPNTTRNITSNLVSVGSRSFEMDDISPYDVGDNIIIYHPCTASWLQAISYGGTHGDPNWAVDSQPLLFNRYIKNIQDNIITIDAPVFNHLDRSLAQSVVYKFDRTGLLTNIGIENLRIDIVTSGGTDENHAWNAIDLYQLEDAWVKNCTMLHFGLSGIRTNTATRVTIENCRAMDPISIIEGSKRYNFQLYTASQLILFTDCFASNGRHHYVSNGTSSVSGCVFYNCVSTDAFTSSEGHRRWSMGLLFDNHLELNGPWIFLDPRLLGLYNRGNYGSSHGWAAVHSVCWNCDVANGDIAIQKPPTAQNYAIGCAGNRVTGTFFLTCPFREQQGYIEGTNTTGLEPVSLFQAQLSDRLSESPGQPEPLVDSFSDGNFTTNPVWTGDTYKWQIVNNSDVSTGANASYTLRLSEPANIGGTKYLSTQRTKSWGVSQSWGFWIGRRLTPVSSVNQSIVWLWANESYLTSPTINGYRVRFGDNEADDEIVLQRVDNGSASDILSSSIAIPNNLTDIGFLIRITRTETSEWSLYTSVLPFESGQGATAATIPYLVSTKVYHGSTIDATYTDFSDGYFGFMASHDADTNSRAAAEFDQFYFDTRSDAPLPVELISFSAIPGNGEVDLNWSTASEINNVGYIILRRVNEIGDYSDLASYKNNIHLQGAGNTTEQHFYHYTDINVSSSNMYWYKLLDLSYSGLLSEYGPISARPLEQSNLPKAFQLHQNYPNPFNSRTVIRYELPVNCKVVLSIYNLLGQKVATLVSEFQTPGVYDVKWDASKFASGVYYYYLTAGEFQNMKKITLIK